MGERVNDLAADGWELVTMDDVDDRVDVMLRRRIGPLPPPESPESPESPDEAWYADPSGRFDERYWSGRGWTFHVARQADDAVRRDPPTARHPAPDMHQ